jgi:hypothetical protein
LLRSLYTPQPPCKFWRLGVTVHVVGKASAELRRFNIKLVKLAA